MFVPVLKFRLHVAPLTNGSLAVPNQTAGTAAIFSQQAVTTFFTVFFLLVMA
jgi:hypothetical protein